MADTEIPTETPSDVEVQPDPDEHRASLLERLRAGANPVELRIEGGPALPTPDPARVRVWYAASGPAVERVQRLLGVLGIYPIGTEDADDDGLFGNTTDVAVRGFQRFVGLPENGIVDDETWTALEHAAGSVP